MSIPPLSGRVAVVTGASAGIGQAVAHDLATAGASVVVNARRGERVEALATTLNKEAGRTVAAAAAGDCSDTGVIKAMLETARRAFGAPADLVVVNAGRGLDGSVLTSDTEQWEEMIRTNLIGAACLMREAALEMTGDGRPRERARDIIVIGSVVGRNVSPFSSMYGSTKFAVGGLAEGLRREVGPKGVRVTLVLPGFVVSEFQGVAGYKDRKSVV